jgi:Zn-dependent oligopeptidase
MRRLFSYLWADVISTMRTRLTEGNGLGDKGREEALRKRFSVEILQIKKMLQKFRGRDPKSDALIEAAHEKRHKDTDNFLVTVGR